MVFEKTIYNRRMDRMRRQLSSLKADGLYATPSSNLSYLTGIDFHRSERLTALFLFRDRDPFVVCPAFEEARLRQMSAVSEVHVWQETEDPFRMAAGLFPGGR
jgi:Xaa-Pro dipeptidase